MHYFESRVTLPLSLEDAWDFFSNPENLGKLSPEDMNFRIIDLPEGEIYPGMLIRYRMRANGLPIKWTSLISEIQAPFYFIDEQLEGPFKYWHHEHHLREVKEGVEVLDRLYYRLPLSWVGKLMNTVLVKRKISSIFAFRHQKLQELFGTID